MKISAEYTGIDLSLELRFRWYYEKIELLDYGLKESIENGIVHNKSKISIFRISNKRNQRMHNRIWNDILKMRLIDYGYDEDKGKQ